MSRKKKDVIDEIVEEVEKEAGTETIEMPAEEKPKKSNRHSRKKKIEDTSEFENQLVFFYSVVNSVLASRISEFATITEDENRKLAKSTLALMQEYNIAISSKYSALFGFITAHATVYGFRIYMYAQRKSHEEKEYTNNPA